MPSTAGKGPSTVDRCLKLIEQFLAGELTFNDFRELYLPPMLSAGPDVDPAELEFLDLVNERWEWTAEDPAP